MAAVQRKLVHKQFNSPMGLYSQQNVKETLNRELKAFGQDGIEVDDQATKPFNAANSAVLRAVEEEEQMKCEEEEKEEITCQRQSRPRQRPHPYLCQQQQYQPHTPLHQQQLEEIKTQYLSHQHDITIDRDTVLKINRLATRRNLHKRDHSWPPPHTISITARQDSNDENEAASTRCSHSRSTSQDNAVHFAESVCKRHGIDALREKFSSPSRVIEPTAKEVLRRRKIEKVQQQRNSEHKSMVINTPRSKSSDGGGSDGTTLTNAANNKDNTSSMRGAATRGSDWTQLAHAKARAEAAFKIDDGHVGAAAAVVHRNVVAVDVDGDEANYDDDDDEIVANTPMDKGFSAPETKAADLDIGLVEPRRQYYEQLANSKCWRSVENVSAAIATANKQEKLATTAVAINNKRQSYSLERGRDAKQRRQQLPPLKPRAGANSSIGVGGGSGVGTTAYSTASSGNLSKSPKLQRRSIKLATEIKICYDTPDEERLTMTSAKLPTRTITNTTATPPQIKQFNYDEAESNRTRNSIAHDSIKLQQQLATDLEHIPLPPTPTTASKLPTITTHAAAAQVRRKHVDTAAMTGKMQHQVDTTKSSKNYKNYDDYIAAPAKKPQLQCIAKKPQPNSVGQEQSAQTHLTPVTVEQRERQQNDKLLSERIYDKTRRKSSTSQRQDLLNNRSSSNNAAPISAQQIYDDACIYLRSIDLQDQTVAYIPAAITIVPSPTEEMLQRWKEPAPLRAAIEAAEANVAESHEMTAAIPASTPATALAEATSPMPRSTSSTPTTKLPTSCQNNENLRHATMAQGTSTSESMAEHVCNPRNDNILSDLTDMPIASPTYITRSPGIQLTRQSSVNKRKSEPQTPQTPLSDASTTTGGGHFNNATAMTKSLQGTGTEEPKKMRRPQGIYYTDGEYLFGPFDAPSADAVKIQALAMAPTTTAAKSQIDIEIRNEIDDKANKLEIAKLEDKYGKIQQSIGEHLRQIDAYMAEAKRALNRSLQQVDVVKKEQQQQQQKSQDEPPTKNTADIDAELWQIFAARQSPILVVESPLQALLRQICRKATISPQSQLKTHAGELVENSEIDDDTRGDAGKTKPIENMPIIEQALLELSNIAASILDYETKLMRDVKSGISAAAAVEQQHDESSTLKPILKRNANSDLSTTTTTTVGELLSLERSSAPCAATPKHVTIPEDTAEHELNIADHKTAKFDIELSAADGNQITADAVLDEHFKLEHVADVVANYEQLSANTVKPPTAAFLASLNIAAAKAYADSKITQSASEAGAATVPAPPTSPPSIAAQPPRDGSKNVVSGFITSRQSREHLVEQVIDILDSQSNQKQSPATSSACKVANLNQVQTQTPQSQQQSARYNEREEEDVDVAISPQPQNNIISASAANITSHEGSSCSSKQQKTPTGSKCMEHADDDVEVDSTDKKPHQALQPHQIKGCAMCGANTTSGTWGKLTLADQRRLENLRHDNFDTYQATYEIRSPYISRQISWEDTLEKSAETDTQKSAPQIAEETKTSTTMAMMQPPPPPPPPPPASATKAPPSGQHSLNQKLITSAAAHGSTTVNSAEMQSAEQTKLNDATTTSTTTSLQHAQQQQRQRATTPNPPFCRYPAPLIEPHVPTRAASPFGLNALDTDALLPLPPPARTRRSASPMPLVENQLSFYGTASDIGKYAYVPQVEGHNIGLLVRTATPPPPTAAPHPKYTYASIQQEQHQHAPHSASNIIDTVGCSRRVDDDDNDNVDDAELQHFNSIATSSSPSAAAIENTTASGAATPTTNSAIVGVGEANVRARNRKSTEGAAGEKVRSISQPPPFEFLMQHYYGPATASTMMTSTSNDNSIIDLTHNSADESQFFTTAAPTSHQQSGQQPLLQYVSATSAPLHCSTSRGGSGIVDCNVINRSFDNVSPRPYITIEGYKRVAWPPTSEERIIREFTPQPQSQQPQLPAGGQQYSQAHQQQQPTQTAPAAATPPAPSPAQGPIYNNVHNVQPAARQSSPYPSHYQQEQKHQQTPQQQQQQYSPPQNHQQQYQQPQQQQYQQPQQQYQQPPQEKPIQYSQAQFSRQASREPAAPYRPQSPRQQQQPQQQQHPEYQQQQHVPYQQVPVQEPTSPLAGWKTIRPPMAKQGNQYNGSIGSESNYPVYAPPTQQQQQYRAPSHDQHQQPQQPIQPQYQAPQPQYNQQHQQPIQQQYQQPPIQNQYQAPYQQQQQPPSWAHQQQPQSQYQQPQQQYQAPSNYPLQQQQPQYQAEPQINQYNSYSQQQHQPISQDQPDHQQQHQPQVLPQDYRGGSPGFITLRQQTPVTQRPIPVYTSQPAAVSFQGGINMRGDLKWPPPEYKVAAERENEDRRKLALGPVCRPRKVARDYTTFFAKNALNSAYPTYKVPPGTQHMLE